ncbi:MAG: deoxyribose-phosphate aldolase [Chitinophagaceae bacterium]|nr:deoxyribose-phosphate aldolase [Chitinophagaceae bacterium]
MNVASYIDHTVLKPTTVLDDVQKVCEEALEYKFAAVCVPPPFVRACREFLKGSDVKVATVIGFPFGYSVPKAKLCEVEQAIQDGCDELDVVINISAAKSGLWNELEDEMTMLLAPIHANDRKIKVIIESGILTDDEIVTCCRIYGALGVDYVKTSTGYAETGATLKAVQLMKANLPSGVKIKAAGGIKTYALAKQFIEAGANRIGSSSGVGLVKQQSEEQ